MSELSKAFVARLIHWLTPKPAALPEPPLKPGICECTHARCHHKDGKGSCFAQYEPNSEENKTDFWLGCACQCFILDDDDDDDGDPETPSPKELERLYSK